MTVPPVEWNDDGSSTFTLVGTEADVQAAVEEVPEGIPVDVERVGGRSVRPESVRDELSDRQRETVETAVSAGYYDTPATRRPGRSRRRWRVRARPPRSTSSGRRRR